MILNFNLIENENEIIMINKYLMIFKVNLLYN